MQYCKTEKALKWLNDGDIIQHLATERYYMKKDNWILYSKDAVHWLVKMTMNDFATDEEWRSITNLHYYDEIEGKKAFLTQDNRSLSEDDPEVDKTKKRWYTPNLYKEGNDDND